jgi:SDR family mycofactocin-dependent oxidoreductase
MGEFTGKVAFITGAARGQGRSHAIRFAEEGADIVALDICEQIDSVAYPMSNEDDAAETVKAVENLDRQILFRQTDVRDYGAVQKVVDEGLSEFGRIDFVSANAGVMPMMGEGSQQRQAFLDCIDVMLTGVYTTLQSVIPSMVERNEGGSIVITSSTAGLRGYARGLDGMSAGLYGYIAAKHGVVGLMRIFANALGPHNIRVNTVHPTGVNSPMVVNDEFAQWVAENPDIAGGMQNSLPVELVEPRDISNAVVWLCSEGAKYITGTTLPVDAGFCNR